MDHRFLSSSTIVAIALVTAICGHVLFSQAKASPVIAFVGATVVPMDTERTIEDQTVLVRDGVITALGPNKATTVPDGATRIDARGKFLMPGLADMHVHLPPVDGTPGDAADIHMRLFLANGVTTVRGMMGHPANIILRDRVARGELRGPTIVAAGPPISGKNVADAAAAGGVVEEQRKAGFDLLKVWEGLSPEAYAAVAEHARKAGLPIAGHVTATVGLDRALAAKQSSIEHLDGYLQALVKKDSPVPPTGSQVVLGPVLEHIDESKMKELARRTREAGVYNTPTLTLFKIVVSEDAPDVFLEWPEMQYISEALRGQFAKQKAGTAGIEAPTSERARYLQLRDRMTKALADEGAGILVGPDSPQMFLVPGFATHREIGSLVSAGLTPFAAISAATRTPAAYLGKEKEFGTVAVGTRADLLLLDASPLADVANLRKRAGVMVRGSWIPASELDRMLAEIAALHKPK